VESLNASFLGDKEVLLPQVADMGHLLRRDAHLAAYFEEKLRSLYLTIV
jgi:hypothetical protein